MEKSLTEESARASLLKSGRELFLKNTYSNISIRRIADRAKVNSAMIAYYFGSKSGLFREVIRSFIASKIDIAEQSIGCVDNQTLADFYSHFYRNIPSELTHLILRTMIFERGETRDWLLSNLMRPAFDVATKVSESMIKGSGRDVDPVVLRTVLQSLLVFPKLIQPVLVELESDKISDDFYRQLAQVNADFMTNYFNLEKK